MTIDLNKLAAELHEAAAARGFWDIEDALEKHIAKMFSEIGEIVQEDRLGTPALYVDDITFPGIITDINVFDGRKPEGVAAEMADYVMMMLDMFHELAVDIDKYAALYPYEAYRSSYYDKAANMPVYNTAILMAQPICDMLTNDKDKLNNAVISAMLIAVYNTRLWLEVRGYDLFEIIRLKMAYNESRPALHGRKY